MERVFAGDGESVCPGVGAEHAAGGRPGAAAGPAATRRSRLGRRGHAAAGAPLRAADLRQRQWFAAGDTVQLVAHGKGFSVGGRAQAMGPGIEGRPVRVRTDNGRVLSGLPVGQGRVELAL